MKCQCGGKTKVIDNVETTDNEVFRKRKCEMCGEIFYTAEFEVEATDEFEKRWRANYRDRKRSEKINAVELIEDDSEEAGPMGYKTEAIKAAKQLGYGPKVVNMVKNAKNDSEIARIMYDARNGSIR